MVSKSNVHGPATFMQATGFVLPGFPSMGAWISYGLGSLNDDLPTFVVLPDPRGLPPNGHMNWSPGFLPAEHQATMVQPSAKTPIADLFPPDGSYVTRESDADGLAILAALNREHEATRPGDSRLDARIRAYELAARMQLSAPEVLDLRSEPAHILRMYGLDKDNTITPPTAAIDTRRRSSTSAATAWSRGGCWSAACGSCRSGAGPTTASRAAIGIRTKISKRDHGPLAAGWAAGRRR